MDALSLSLVILVFFIPLLAFFATAKWDVHDSGPEVAHTVTLKETLHSDFITNRLQRPRSRSAAREYYAPVLRQNVAVARLMRMEGAPLI
jgi:hypothetical protein